MKILKRYFSLPLEMRTWLMTTGSMLINTCLALYHGLFGFLNDSDILVVLSFFYILLAMMRIFLGSSIRKYFKKTPDDFIRSILLLSGMLMVVLGLVLSRVIYNMVLDHEKADFGSFSTILFFIFALIKIAMTGYGIRLSRRQKDPIFTLIQRTTLAETLFCTYSLILSIVPILNNLKLEEFIYTASGIVFVGIVLALGIDNLFSHKRYDSILDDLDIPTYEEVNENRSPETGL